MEFFIFPISTIVMYKCNEADATIIRSLIPSLVLTCSKRLCHDPSIVGYALENSMNISSIVGDGRDTQPGCEYVDELAEKIMDAHDKGIIIPNNLIQNLEKRIEATADVRALAKRCRVPRISGIPSIKDDYIDFYLDSCINGFFVGINTSERLDFHYPLLFPDLIPLLQERVHGYAHPLKITYREDVIIFGENPSAEAVKITNKMNGDEFILNASSISGKLSIAFVMACGYVSNPRIYHGPLFYSMKSIPIEYDLESETIFLH